MILQSHDSEVRACGLGFGVKSFGFRAFWSLGSEFRTLGLELRVLV